MFDQRASHFWQATIRSGLMDVESLTVCWNAIDPKKREDPEHIDRRLARQAVQLNLPVGPQAAWIELEFDDPIPVVK